MSELSTHPAPASVPARESLVLTERERELILQLRRVDFFRAGRERYVTVDWSGARLRVFDAVQIR